MVNLPKTKQNLYLLWNIQSWAWLNTAFLLRMKYCMLSFLRVKTVAHSRKINNHIQYVSGFRDQFSDCLRTPPSSREGQRSLLYLFLLETSPQNHTCNPGLAQCWGATILQHRQSAGTGVISTHTTVWRNWVDVFFFFKLNNITAWGNFYAYRTMDVFD